MITSKELRNKIEILSAKNKLPRIKRSSFINGTFKGDFNYSIGEEPIMRKFGKYIPIEKNWSFSVFQPCIRIPDFYKEIKKNSLNHLAVFEMSDIGGIHLSKKSNGEKIKGSTIKNAFYFLTKTLKIDKKNIYVSYFSGNTLKNLSQNKIKKDKILSPDEKTCGYFRKLGLSESQLISDSTSRTFVLTFFPFEFYSGYRSEIFVKLKNNSLLEVGTFEFLNWQTRLDTEGQLKDLGKLDGFFGGCAIGFERALMAANNYSDILQCDHILPLYQNILKLSKNRDFDSARIACETIRFLQAILGDGYDFSKDEYPKRKKKVKKIVYQLSKAADKLKINLNEQIDPLLRINAELTYWKPDSGAYSQNIEKIKKFILSIKKNGKIHSWN